MDSSATPDTANHRACAHCRSQKVRCFPDESALDSCRRCAKAGRTCVFTAPQKRKQRKRTDTRVAELEKEMRAMRALMGEKDDAAKQKDAHEADLNAGGFAKAQEVRLNESDVQQLRSGELSQRGIAWPTDLQSQGFSEERSPFLGAWAASDPSRTVPKAFTEQPVGDVVDRGILSITSARQLFEFYRRELFPHYPAVSIPPECTADDLRRSKPALFLAVLAAASTKSNPELSAVLDYEVLQAYASRNLMNSEKSIELVQALIVSATWYHPPDRFGQLKYNEYIHMAATMAIDIGIGSRPTPSRTPKRHSSHQITKVEDPTNQDLSMTPRSRSSSPSRTSIESRRTFLACYLICAGLSLSLRRPNMLRMNSWGRECLDYIEKSPHAIPSDKLLRARIKLMMIGEEISTAFSFDDPAELVSLSELRIQLMLKDFIRRLNAWECESRHVMDGSLAVMYYTLRIFANEIVLHIDYAPEDFKAPYQMGRVQVDDSPDVPTAPLVNAIAEIVNGAHALLDVFIAIDPEVTCAFPVFTYVRVSYAAFVLAKLCLSASRPESRLAHAIDLDSLQIESYLNRAIAHVKQAVGPMRRRVPAIFLALLFKLRLWCRDPDILYRDDVSAPAERLATPEMAQTQVREMRAIEGYIRETSLPGNDRIHEVNSGTANMTPENSQTSGSETQAKGPPHERQAKSYNTEYLEVTGPIRTTGDDQQVPASYLVPSDEMELDNNFHWLFDNSATHAWTGNVVWNSNMDFLGDSSRQVPDMYTWPTNGQGLPYS